MAKHSPTQEDVLGAFAMDFELGTGVLERYLSEYPEYSIHLIDLSRELSRELDDDRSLSVDELAIVNAGMRRLQEHTTTLQYLQNAPAKTFTEAAKELAWPMQVGLALRERRIDVSTIPAHILEKFGRALRVSATALHSYLALPPQVSQLRASKSSVKPTAAEKVSFERVLREAGLNEEALSNLLDDE